MSRPLILSFYFLSALVGIYLLHELVLTSRIEQKLAAQTFDYSQCDPNDPSKNPDDDNPHIKQLGSSRHDILKKYLLPYLYMDEEFHVPQSASYFFLGNYSHWDPMITTPFGSYSATYLLLRPIFFIRAKLGDSQTMPVWATSPQLDPRISEFIGAPERAVRYLCRAVLSWNRKPSDVVTLCRVSNAFVATIAVSILLSAFAKMTLRRVNERFLVPVTREDCTYNEETRKYELNEEHAEVLKKLGEARSNILQRCKRILVPAVLQVGFYPTFFFFTALYYTEPMSVLCLAAILYCYQVFDRRSVFCWFLIAAVGLCSVLVRQTNIVWVAYFAASHLIDVLFFGNGNGFEFESSSKKEKQDDVVISKEEQDDDDKHNKKKNKKKPSEAEADDGKKQEENSSDQQSPPLPIASNIFNIIFYTLPIQLPVILLGVSFIAWVIYFNDGAIVVGDKTAHTPTVHLAQIPLMFSFFCLFSPFQALAAVFEFGKSLIASISAHSRNKRFTSFAVILFAVTGGVFKTAAKNMQFHAYLIADNRHYTFYLYRYILRHEKLRMALCVVGGCCGLIFVMRDTFKCLLLTTTTTRPEQQGTTSRSSAIHLHRIQLRALFQDLLFIMMSAICIVPQKLIEPRYFLVPAIFHIFRSTMNRLEAVTMTKHERVKFSIFGEDRAVVEETVDRAAMMQTLDVGVNLIIHVLTMHVFLFWPFWAPDGTIGRFIW